MGRLASPSLLCHTDWGARIEGATRRRRAPRRDQGLDPESLFPPLPQPASCVGAVTALNESPGSRRKPALSGTRHSPWELWALKLGHGHGSHLFTSCQRGSKVGHTVAWAPRMGERVQRKVRCVFLLQARPGGLGTLCGVLPSACPLPCLTSLSAFALVWGQCGAWAPLPLAPVLGAVGPSR